MSRLEFSDGVSFDTSGPYRIERRHDGLYVVGHGFLCAVDDREEGEKLIDELEQAEVSFAERRAWDANP
jgi:hypothetical protein